MIKSTSGGGSEGVGASKGGKGVSFAGYWCRLAVSGRVIDDGGKVDG